MRTTKVVNRDGHNVTYDVIDLPVVGYIIWINEVRYRIINVRNEGFLKWFTHTITMRRLEDEKYATVPYDPTESVVGLVFVEGENYGHTVDLDVSYGKRMDG